MAGARHTRTHPASPLRCSQLNMQRRARAFGYAGYSAGRWSAHVGASAAHNSYLVRRAFGFAARLPEAFGGGSIFGGVNRDATSSPVGLATDVWGDWDIPIRFGNWVMRPSALLRHAHYARRAWSESRADSLSLSAPGEGLDPPKLKRASTWRASPAVSDRRLSQPIVANWTAGGRRRGYNCRVAAARCFPSRACSSRAIRSGSRLG